MHHFFGNAFRSGVVTLKSGLQYKAESLRASQSYVHQPRLIIEVLKKGTGKFHPKKVGQLRSKKLKRHL